MCLSAKQFQVGLIPTQTSKFKRGYRIKVLHLVANQETTDRYRLSAPNQDYVMDNVEEFKNLLAKISDFIEDISKEYVGKTCILKYGKYKGRKAKILEVLDIDFNSGSFRKSVVLHVGIERLDGKPGYLEVWNPSFVRLNEVEIECQSVR